MKKILALSCLSLMIVACAKTTTSKINNTHNSSGESTLSVQVKQPNDAEKNSKIKSTSTKDSTSSASLNMTDNQTIDTTKLDEPVKLESDASKNEVEVVTPETTQITEETAVETNDNPNVELKDNHLNIDSSRSNVANISWHWPDKGNIIEKFTNASKGIDISGLLGDKILIGDDGKVVYSGNEAAIRSTLLSISIALDIISSKFPLGVTTIYKVIVSNHIKFS